MDSITMNLGKSDSPSLSEDVPNSEGLRLNFLFEKPVFVFCWSDAPPHTTESNL